MFCSVLSWNQRKHNTFNNIYRLSAASGIDLGLESGKAASGAAPPPSHAAHPAHSALAPHSVHAAAALLEREQRARDKGQQHIREAIIHQQNRLIIIIYIT